MRTKFNFVIDKHKCQTTTDLSFIGESEKDCCVVAVIGKSRRNNVQSKVGFIYAFTKSEFFNKEDLPKRNITSVEDVCYIEGCYDSTANVIYLHLVSNYDPANLAQLCSLAKNNKTNQNFLDLWRQAEHSHTRALLFILSISHIILLVSPGVTFDPTYIHLFKTLDALRLKLQPHVSDILQGCRVPRAWCEAGRPCCPRVLFVFDSASSSISDDQSGTAKKSVSKTQQRSLEDLIYRMLRKDRIITNISNNSLFAVPSSQDFVFVGSASDEGLVWERDSFFLSNLFRDCSQSKQGYSYQATRRARPTKSSADTRLDDICIADPKTSQPEEARDRPSSNEVRGGRSHRRGSSFTEFLRPNIELALGRGFDDNIGRNTVAAVFEVCTFGMWFETVQKLHGLMLVDTWEPKISTILSNLHDIDIRFSESRCAKLLPLAQATYQEGLPSHYTLAYHLSKLEQAEQLFIQHARGCVVDTYLERLQADCQTYWLNGHQMCEEISLTGNHCVNELHRLTDMPVLEDTAHLPVLDHYSDVITKSYCNCGRTSAERQDPFNHRAANYDFYAHLETNCCGTLYHYKLLTFSSSDPQSNILGRTDLPNTPQIGLEPQGSSTPSVLAPDWKGDGRFLLGTLQNQSGVKYSGVKFPGMGSKYSESERVGSDESQRVRSREDKSGRIRTIGAGESGVEHESNEYLGDHERLSQTTQEGAGGEISPRSLLIRKESSKFDFTGALASLSLVLSLDQFNKDQSVGEECSDLFPDHDDLAPNFMSRTSGRAQRSISGSSSEGDRETERELTEREGKKETEKERERVTESVRKKDTSHLFEQGDSGVEREDMESKASKVLVTEAVAIESDKSSESDNAVDAVTEETVDATIVTKSDINDLNVISANIDATPVAKTSNNSERSAFTTVADSEILSKTDATTLISFNATSTTFTIASAEFSNIPAAITTTNAFTAITAAIFKPKDTVTGNTVAANIYTPSDTDTSIANTVPTTAKDITSIVKGIANTAAVFANKDIAATANNAISTNKDPATLANTAGSFDSIATATVANVAPSLFNYQEMQQDLFQQNEIEQQDQLQKKQQQQQHVFKQQHSTIDYLPGMLHSESVPGLLPKFSSWSLVRLLDDPNDYDPSVGLDMPGFAYSDPYLLPLDLSIEFHSPEVKVTSVRLYLGLDYECPRGHRVLGSAADLQTSYESLPQAAAQCIIDSISGTNVSIIQDQSSSKNACGLLSQDIPLYTCCPCGTTNPVTAQLMRLHVVVPDGPIRVQLRPQVQPATAPCPLFRPEANDGLLIDSSGLWVLRLPYIYLGERGPYRQPSDQQGFTACRLLKGFINIC